MRGITSKFVVSLAALQVLMGALHPLTAFAGQTGRPAPHTVMAAADHCNTHLGGRTLRQSQGRDLARHHCCDTGHCQCSIVAIAVSDLRVAKAGHGTYRSTLRALLLPTHVDDLLRPPIA